MSRLDTSHVYADTRSMTREQWLDSRRNGIGGSDASSILGMNPYSSPLRVYQDKIGKGVEKETNEAMRQGTDLEGYVAQRFMEQTGMKVKKCNRILQHPEYPWMLANIDRQIMNMNAGLECKTTSPYSKFKFDEGEINPHYYWQSVHYMAVTGAERWYVAVLVLGKAFHVFEIVRDEAQIQTLIDAERNFWENHVVPKIPPLPTGAESDDEAIKAIYPQGSHDGEDILALDDIVADLILRAEKKRHLDALEKEIAAIDQSIKMRMGEYTHGIGGNWNVSWTNSITNRVDTKLLKAKYPQVAAAVTKPSSGRRFTITEIDKEE